MSPEQWQQFQIEYYKLRNEYNMFKGFLIKISTTMIIAFSKGAAENLGRRAIPRDQQK